MKNTELTVPLNRRMALASMFENDSYITTVDENIVADINTRTMHFTTRQIYCSGLNFKYFRDGQLKSGRDLVD